jgi:hypothetical protein
VVDAFNRKYGHNEKPADIAKPIAKGQGQKYISNSFGHVALKKSEKNKQGLSSLVFYRNDSCTKQIHEIFAAEDANLFGFTDKHALIFVAKLNQFSIWDCSVNCKHTDAHKWKSAADKASICKQCACKKTFDGDEDLKQSSRFVAAHNSKYNKFILLFVHCLIVIDPVSLKMTKLTVDIGTTDKNMYGCYFTRKIVHESMSKGADPRHYVGLQTSSHHHIIDFTANKIISTVPTALPYCYLGSSTRIAVVKNDIYTRESSISIQDFAENMKEVGKIPFDNSVPVLSLFASKTGSALFVATARTPPVMNNGCPGHLSVYLWEAGLLVDMVDIKQSYITRAMRLEEDDHVVRTGLYAKLWFPVRLVVRTRFTDK